MTEQLTATPIVCVDLNGVLDQYTGWKDPKHWDPPRRGAARFLASLASAGFRVVIFTTRYPPDARRWLRRYGLDRHVAEVTDRKPPAHVFVDDRAVCFRGSFGSALKSVRKFKAHWERVAVNSNKRSRKKTSRRAKRHPSGVLPRD